MPAEIGKFLAHVTVDPAFVSSLGNDGDNEAKSSSCGTVRATTCRVLAGTHNDVCDQCRLLQVGNPLRPIYGAFIYDVHPFFVFFAPPARCHMQSHANVSHIVRFWGILTTCGVSYMIP